MDKQEFLASIGNNELLDIYFQVITKSLYESQGWIDIRASILLTKLDVMNKYKYSIADIKSEIESRLVPRETIRLIVK